MSVNSQDGAGPTVDTKALNRLIIKLKKTLERPDQAELELDPDGFLNLSALGGKFRLDKLCAILGLDKEVAEPRTVYSKFKKAVTKINSKTFEWQLPNMDHQGAVLSVRVLGYKPQVSASEEPFMMFPGAVPHTLRGLVDKSEARRQELFRAHLKVGVPVIFVEPKSIVEYRGCANDPVINFLDNARNTGAYQIAILSWAGIKSGPTVRLDKVQARATYMIEQLGLQDIPAFSCCGHRIGLVALARLAADALDTNAVVWNKGREMAEGAFGQTGSKLLESIGFESDQRVPVWLYASQSTRSTSSTGSNISHDGDYGETPEAAATFACNMWASVYDSLGGDTNKDNMMRAESFVIVDTNVVVDATKAFSVADNFSGVEVPYKSLEAMLKPQQSIPDETFTELASQVSTDATFSIAYLRERCVQTPLKITPGGLLTGAILRCTDTEYQPLLKKHAELLISIVEETPNEMIQILLAVSDAATIEKIKTSMLKIFKLLYDLDITPEEDAYFAWEKRVVSRGNALQVQQTLAKVKPFLDWLKEAEEEESDAEENI